MNIDIKYFNVKNPSNGYQEWYIGDGNNYLILRGNCKNNKIIGYAENHNAKQTKFYIK